MKILQVIYSLASGGAERFVVDLSNELTYQGHEVILCVFRDDALDSSLSFYKHLIHPNVKYVNLKIPSGIRFSDFYTVYKLIKSIRPDVIHCHLNVVPFFYLQAFFNSTFEIFHTLHSVAPATVGRAQYQLNKYFYRTNKIRPITISRNCDNSYREFYNLNNSTIIDNGSSAVIPTEELEITKREINRYKTSENDLVFIHVARYHELKNQLLLIDTFNLLNEKKINYILLIIGANFDSDEGIKLQKKACSRIKFLGPKKNVGDYLLNSDAFCLTSFYEGLPISLLEAISAGCVPICTPVGGIPNVIEDGITGYLSTEITLDSYLNAIDRYLQNPSFINKETLKQQFSESFSIDICAKKHINLFNQVMDL